MRRVFEARSVAQAEDPQRGSNEEAQVLVGSPAREPEIKLTKVGEYRRVMQMEDVGLERRLRDIGIAISEIRRIVVAFKRQELHSPCIRLGVLSVRLRYGVLGQLTHPISY